jgi:hypothetical protein
LYVLAQVVGPALPPFAVVASMKASGLSDEAITEAGARLIDKDGVLDSEVAVMFGAAGLRLPFRVNHEVLQRLPTVVRFIYA